MSIDQLDLFLHFLEHLGKSALLKDRLGAQQIFFGSLRLRWRIDHVKGADDLVGLGDVERAVAVKRCLEFLHTNKSFKSISLP